MAAAGRTVVVVRRCPSPATTTTNRAGALFARVVVFVTAAATERPGARTTHRGRPWWRRSTGVAAPSSTIRAPIAVALVRRSGRRRLRRPLSKVRKLLPFLSAGKYRTRCIIDVYR